MIVVLRYGTGKVSWKQCELIRRWIDKHGEFLTVFRGLNKKVDIDKLYILQKKGGGPRTQWC